MSHALAYLLVRMTDGEETGFGAAADWLEKNDLDDEGGFIVCVSRKAILWYHEEGWKNAYGDIPNDWGLRDDFKDKTPKQAFDELVDEAQTEMLATLGGSIGVNPDTVHREHWLQQYHADFEKHITAMKGDHWKIDDRIDMQVVVSRIILAGYPFGFAVKDNLYTTLGGIFAIDSVDGFDWNDTNLAIVVLDYIY